MILLFRCRKNNFVLRPDMAATLQLHLCCMTCEPGPSGHQVQNRNDRRQSDSCALETAISLKQSYSHSSSTEYLMKTKRLDWN